MSRFSFSRSNFSRDGAGRFGLQFILRFSIGLVLALLIRQAFAPAPPSVTPPPPPIQSPVLDLQLVRLFEQTRLMGWDAGTEAQYLNLMRASGRAEQVRFLPHDNPSSLGRLSERAEDALIRGDWSGARTAFERILAEQAHNAPALIALGILNLPDPTAYEHLQQAADFEHPQQPLAAALLSIINVEGYAWRDLGLRLIEHERWALADFTFSQQLAEQPLEAFSYAYRGYARAQLGRLEQARADLEQAIALEPFQALGYYLLGLYHRLNGAYDLSVDALSDAHLLDSKNPALAAELAQAHQINDNYPLAEEWFNVALDLAPDDPRFIALRAAFYADTAYNLADGALWLAEIAEAYPQDLSIQASWGRVLYHEANYPEAERVLNRNLTRAPSDPRSLFYAAELAERRGERLQAIDYYSRLSLLASPYADKARAALARLTR